MPYVSSLHNCKNFENCGHRTKEELCYKCDVEKAKKRSDEYRKKNYEKIKENNKIYQQRFREVHPDRWREINKLNQQKYKQKKKLLENPKETSESE